MPRCCISWSQIDPLLDASGQPCSRWDGKTWKTHPVTGERSARRQRPPAPYIAISTARQIGRRQVSSLAIRHLLAQANARRCAGDGCVGALRSDLAG